MARGPTPDEETNEVETGATAWRRSPLVASTIRAAAFLLPLVGSWFLIGLLSPVFFRPEGGFGLVLWIVQAITVGVIVAWLIGTVSRRLLPLAALFNFSMVFPERAPSRFRVALRAGSANQLPAGTSGPTGDDETSVAQDFAEAAVGMVAELGFHDRLTRGHSERVRAYADLIAEEMKLPEQDRIRLSWGALLHDFGKFEVPTEILTKNERPAESDWATLAEHPADAEMLLAPLAQWLGPWIGAATQHHEHWDCSGYPTGLGGNRISLAGRITAVADAYDTMTSAQSYRQALTAEEACDELVACSGTQFDADVVQAFLRVPVERRSIAAPVDLLAALPGIGSVHTAVVSAVATSALVAVTLGTGVHENMPPTDLAFAEELTEDEAEDSTDSTSAPSSTNSTSTAASRGAPASNSPTSTEGAGSARPSAVFSPTSTTNRPDTTNTTAPATTASTQPPPTQASSTSATAEQATTSPSTQPTTQTTTATTQATTTTTASPPNPIAYDDEVEVVGRRRAKIYVLANDDDDGGTFDAATLTIVTPPQHASRSLVVGDYIAYQSTSGYVGSDSFQYEICTFAGVCDTAWVSISVVD